MMLKQLLSRDKISEKVFHFIKAGHNVQKPMKMHRFSWKLRAFCWFSLSELYKGKSQQPTRLLRSERATGALAIVNHHTYPLGIDWDRLRRV